MAEHEERGNCMNNQQTIRQVVTKDSLLGALKDVGARPGMVIEVHSSLSALGYVAGGARTVVDALMELCGDSGTILMPMQTGDNTDPSGWENPPVDPALWQVLRDNTPPYHPENTDIQYMGAIPENFRHRNGVVYSGHPSLSYAAWGKYARLLCNRQSIHFPLAEESPTARLYELRGYVLLIGTGYDKCTCMHLAEYRTDCRPIRVDCAAAAEGEENRWRKYLDLALDNGEFEKIGAIMEKKGMVRKTMLNDCPISFFSAVDAVDEATDYFEKTVVYDLYR